MTLEILEIDNVTNGKKVSQTKVIISNYAMAGIQIQFKNIDHVKL